MTSLNEYSASEYIYDDTGFFSGQPSIQWGRPHGLVIKVLDCNIVVSKF